MRVTAKATCPSCPSRTHLPPTRCSSISWWTPLSGMTCAHTGWWLCCRRSSCCMKVPHLLGLNVNAGQAVKPQLCTGVYDGFRAYAEFKELNSTLNHELAQFERVTAPIAGGVAIK
ncbi:hypothetical protein A0H81_09494 [Grifola frondosa]|uniref:Uncharacterized protein n=1 Tax=Grifola frondosa TaxID=5627 RepID=A0A1C7M7H1_GRIFR|nr:hypothetical protein A0H81_09494 [Grifola frondosa]